MLVAIPRVACAAAFILVAACSQDRGDIGLGPSCANGLDSAYRELNQAKVDGLSGSVNWSKAAGLLSAAKVQQQFEEYENCVIKVRQARGYLSNIRG